MAVRLVRMHIQVENIDFNKWWRSTWYNIGATFINNKNNQLKVLADTFKFPLQKSGQIK